MASKKTHEETQALASQLEQKLMALYGAPIISGEDLVKAMGYRSIHSLRKHIYEDTFPIDVFPIPSRRGKFALVQDVAQWLAEQKVAARHSAKQCHQQG